MMFYRVTCGTDHPLGLALYDPGTLSPDVIRTLIIAQIGRGACAFCGSVERRMEELILTEDAVAVAQRYLPRIQRHLGIIHMAMHANRTTRWPTIAN